MYFFPNPFKCEDKFPDKLGSLALTVNSGENALRIALRSYRLPASTKIGVPVFSCNSVYRAVIDEGLTPVFFDIKNDNTYWSNFNKAQIIEQEIKVIIITHLYGFIHPDTADLIDFCRRYDVKVLHDAAQSYGIQESLFGDSIFIYSFSSGKSSTAAAGGEIRNLLLPDMELPQPSIMENIKARLFFNARYLCYKFKNLNNMLDILIRKMDQGDNLFADMSRFQKAKALQAKYLVDNFSKEREERYSILEKSIQGNYALKISYNNLEGLFFKFVLFIEKDVERFVNYLNKHNVPNYRLAKDIELSVREIESLSLFRKNYLNFVEISCERSIELDEIRRVARILSDYNNADTII